MQTAPRKQRPWSGWYTAILIAAGLIFAIAELPAGYSDDLAVIGKGKNVIVVIHDSKKFQSVEFLSLVNDLRDDYRERISFRVADISDKKGADFAREQGVMPPSLLLFSAEGTRLGIITASRSPAVVSDAINRLFQW